MKKTKKVQDPLVGKYFHELNANQEIGWQGLITARVDDLYLAQLFDWIIGAESVQKLVAAADMRGWGFYDSADEMNYHYEIYSRRRDQEERIAVKNQSVAA